jgi:hypothetical protein
VTNPTPPRSIKKYTGTTNPLNPPAAGTVSRTCITGSETDDELIHKLIKATQSTKYPDKSMSATYPPAYC